MGEVPWAGELGYWGVNGKDALAKSQADVVDGGDETPLPAEGLTPLAETTATPSDELLGMRYTPLYRGGHFVSRRWELFHDPHSPHGLWTLDVGVMATFKSEEQGIPENSGALMLSFGFSF